MCSAVVIRAGLPCMPRTHLVHGPREPAERELERALSGLLVAPLLLQVRSRLGLVPVAVERQPDLAALLALEQAPARRGKQGESAGALAGRARPCSMQAPAAAVVRAAGLCAHVLLPPLQA